MLKNALLTVDFEAAKAAMGYKMRGGLLFLGDLFYDYDFIADDIERISDWIADNNFIVIVNLEGAIKLKDSQPVKKRGPNLANNPRVVDVLKKLHVAGVCLANNHIMDFGAESLEHTLRILDENKILHTGAGKNLAEAVKPMVIRQEDTEIAVLSFGWDVEETVYAGEVAAGCAPRMESVILSEVNKAKESGRQVIVCMHWGFEYHRLPMPYDIALGHKIIESGAQLVIGHHPHCVQPRECYKGNMIYYSLGNFYFAGRRNMFQKQFPDKPANQSDYGVAVVYREWDQKCMEWIIRYDSQTDKSYIEECRNDVLEDISGAEYHSPGYRKNAANRKCNRTPILTCNERDNKKALRRLFLYYRVKYILKRLAGR